MDNVYSFMDKSINLGQVFTPPHMAKFAAKLIGIKEGDSVIDTCAGSGALLLAAIETGAKSIYGVEFDDSVFQLLENNLSNLKGIKFEGLHGNMLDEEALQWIKSKNITKAIINPPYETKWKTYDILKNTLTAIPNGTMVALFYPNNKLDKSSKKWKKWFLENNTLHKVIKMPKGLFNPYVSVETSIFIIETGRPQNGKKIFTCNIEDDGLVTKKKEYAQDLKGKWKNELEAYWFEVCMKEEGDSTCAFVDPDKNLSYREPEKPFEIFEEDFKRTAFDYICFKKKINPKELREKVSDMALYGNYKIISNEEYNQYLFFRAIMENVSIKLPSKENGEPDLEAFYEMMGNATEEERREIAEEIVTFG